MLPRPTWAWILPAVHAVASLVTSGAEAAAAVDEGARATGATTAVTVVEIEISGIEETTPHNFEATAAESVIWVGETVRGTIFAADEHHQDPEGRHLAEISENENSK